MISMKKEIPLGKANVLKHWGDTTSRKYHRIVGTIVWDQDSGGTMRPVISVSILNEDGQSLLTTMDLNGIANLPELKNNPTFGYMRLIASEYALGINAGTPEQTACIRRGFALGEYPSLEHRLFSDAHKKYLEKNNMLNVQLPDGTWYRYGQGYANGKPVTGMHLAIIKTLMDWT